MGGTSTGEDVATFCAEGHHGPYCDVCLTGYFGGGQGKACVICEGDSNLAMLYYIGGFLAVALALAIFIYRGGRGALKQIVGVVGKAQGGKNAGAALANAAKAEVKVEAKKAARQATRKAVAKAQEGLKKADKALMENKAGIRAATEGAAAMGQLSEEMEAAGTTRRFSLSGCFNGIITIAVKIVGFIFDFRVKLKILTSMLQVLGPLGVTFDITWPDWYLDTPANLRLIEIDLPALMPFECISPGVNAPPISSSFARRRCCASSSVLSSYSAYCWPEALFAKRRRAGRRREKKVAVKEDGEEDEEEEPPQPPPR